MERDQHLANFGAGSFLIAYKLKTTSQSYLRENLGFKRSLTTMKMHLVIPEIDDKIYDNSEALTPKPPSPTIYRMLSAEILRKRSNLLAASL
ncbi:hypothetical protein V6N13_139010 [Hibiscus sabdariffa]